MTRKRATNLLITSATIGVLVGFLVFLGCPLPSLVFWGFFIIGFICFVVGFVYHIKYIRDDVRNK
jgi:1,4-dihydroxy-2-naphthoate octaprenyltransferase